MLSNIMQCAFQLTTAVHMIIIALCAVHYAICAQIIISPNCTQEDVECYGLSQLYADDPENLKLSSDTTIVFQNGVHSMMSDIVIRGIDNLMLQFEENSQIHCVERAELVFMNVTNLLIFGLKLTNCGAEISESLVKEALSVQTETVLKFEKGLQAAIFAVNIQQFQMDEAVINGSYGYGFLGINIIGDSSVANTLINSSNTNSLTDYCMNPRLTPAQGAKCLGGNALFVFNDYPDCPATINYYTLTVANSTFSHGLDPTGGFHEYISRGAGLGIIVSQKYYDVHVKLINSTFTANTAKVFGSNIYIILTIIATNSSVSIHSSQLMYGNSDNGDGPYSALVFFHGRFENSLGNSKNCSNLQQLVTNCAYHCNLEQELRRQILLIEDSEFYSNAGGALYLVSLTSLLDVRITYTVLIRNCTISKNYAIKGSAMFVSDISSENTRLLEMTVENTLFEDHTTLVETYLGTHSNINLIISVKRFTIKSCTFMNNNKSALMSYDSNIHFEGETIFKNNTARYGGAIHFTGNSVMYLRPNAQIIFDGNSALQRGGAIYLTGGTEVAYFSNCQIQVFDPSFMNISKLNITMKFINNTAVEAGDALYGGEIDLCFALAPSQFLYLNDTLKGTPIFNSVTDFSEQSPSTSCVSSDPEKICFCFDSIHNCSIKSLTFSKYPGEQFKISVIGVGQRDGTVPAVVQTQGNDFQKTGSSCTNATYTVASLESMEELYLTASTTQANSPSPLLVTVNLLECDNLVGFSLDNESRICDCDPKLKERDMTCDIDNRTITRQQPFWLSNYSNYLLLHDNCPYDYCKPDHVQIVMTEPNISEQCAFNRSGILCGSCREGFSHIFGSSRCFECSNNYLSLLIPFAIAGIVLVVFLFVLNLTVSVGTINGLIFYANIVKINETIFFPPGDNGFFRAFISWLNLDLGIETCFYSGMDSLGKIWLQFTFPFYLWAIVLVIIVMLRYSTRLTKLCGNHSVTVLATVFLLSFTKHLRTIAAVFSFTTLDYPSPSGRKAVWLYDGNILYASGGHLALFLFSLFFLLVIAIPYTLLILTVQVLRKYSHRRFLHWVNKFMPIFDAYLGPYKNKQGYWTGLLLLVRVILVAVFTANIFGHSAIDIFFVLIVTIFLILLNLGQGGVYKKNVLTALELSYIVNLALLAAATALVRQINGKPGLPTIYTSCAVALVTFIGTLAYHMKEQIKRWYKGQDGENAAEQENYERLTDGNSGDNNRRPQQVTTTLIEISRDDY